MTAGHIRLLRQDPCQRLAPRFRSTTVEHAAWRVKVVDVGIVIPFLAVLDGFDHAIAAQQRQDRGAFVLLPDHGDA